LFGRGKAADPSPTSHSEVVLSRKGRAGVRCSAQASFDASPCWHARSCQRASPMKGDGAPKSANLWCPLFLSEKRRAPLGAPHAHLLGALPRFALLERMAQLPRTRSACHLRRLLEWFGTGPRFLHRVQIESGPASSAGSQQGLIVVPGGAPMPPECFVATKPAGAAPRPAGHDAS
jgi:hypothetical protein